MGRVNTRINPSNDGINHINMYSKAQTAFGRMLSNFAHFEFDAPAGDGHFVSIEAYWYYMSLPQSVNRDSIRNKYGYLAKKTGRTLRSQISENNLVFRQDFEKCILDAIRLKIKANKHLFKQEYKTLPIVHYYLLPDGRPFDVSNDFPWLIAGINQIVEEECY